MKSGIVSRLLFVFIAVFLVAGLCWASEEEVIKTVLDARAAVKPFPNPSAKLPDLTVEKAYDMQKKLVKALVAKGETVSVFKGGLTTEAAQKKFGVNDALVGQIFKSGELGPDAMVNSKDFVRLFVEQEVGYVIGQKISQPVKDVASLKTMIKEVFPAVELPDLRFEDMKTIKGPDIIVDAVGSAKYIVGKKMPVDKVDVSKVEVTLKLDGQPVNQGKASDCLGDQWKAALWLVNTAVAKGWTIEPGQMLITGAMGTMIPGKPGKYEGDWGSLGTLSWTVK
jgi:2-keto-4-pentenoate hydratase